MSQANVRPRTKNVDVCMGHENDSHRFEHVPTVYNELCKLNHQTFKEMNEWVENEYDRYYSKFLFNVAVFMALWSYCVASWAEHVEHPPVSTDYQ